MLKLLTTFLYLNSISDNYLNPEVSLKRNLFNNYTYNSRPVILYNESVYVRFNLKINSLEYFDQINEKIKLNMEVNFIWKDQYLNWDSYKNNIKYINLYDEKIWKPDLELYNSASFPKKWSEKDSTQLFSDGRVIWNLPILYSFSCPLQLKDFPFDTQTCTMTFGSWKQSKDFLDIKLGYFENNSNYDLVDYSDYSHNEWDIIKVNYTMEDVEYLCCPDELWTINTINIKLRRKYHKYMIVIKMTIFLTISSFVVLCFDMNNYRRTYVLVFIPLSIIWLQLYISSKIPVIEYSTRMEKFILTCYYVSTICSFESGLIYNFLNSHTPNFITSNFKKKKKSINSDDLFNIWILDNGSTKNIDYPSVKKFIFKFDILFKNFLILLFIIIITTIFFD